MSRETRPGPGSLSDRRFRTGSPAACNDLIRTWDNAGTLRHFRLAPQLLRQNRPPQQSQKTGRASREAPACAGARPI
jgi:hypothetical protein